MSREKDESAANRKDPEPRVLKIMPDGRRIVDPMSIIGSDSAKRHLEDIAKIREDIAKTRTSNGDPTKPSPA